MRSVYAAAPIRYSRADMFHALSAPTPPRRLVGLLAILLCGVLLSGPVASVAIAQSSGGSLITPPQTKEQAQEAASAASEAADADDGGFSISIELAFILGAVVVMGAVAFFISRDARSATTDYESAQRKNPVDSSSVRGAPQTMFAGEAAPGGKTGRSKKRAKSKRQKVARRNNR
jgi:hypothetical protein